MKTSICGIGVAIASVALGGCGSSGARQGSSTVASQGQAPLSRSGEAAKPPAQILADAAAAIRGARGYVVQGEITQSGTVERVHVVASRTSLDVAMGGGAGHAEVIILPGGGYVRFDQEFLNAHGGRAGAPVNQWIQVPATSAQSLASSLGQFAPATAARCLVEDHGTLSVAGQTTVAGQSAVVIKDAGNVPGDGAGTLAVATSGAPYPLEVRSTGPKRAGGRVDVCNDGKADNSRSRFTFSHFGNPPTITAPKYSLKAGQQSGVV